MSVTESPRYQAEERAHDLRVAAIEQAAAPVAALAELYGIQLALAELALEKSADPAARAALHRWLGAAACTARALALGWARRRGYWRMELRWPDRAPCTLLWRGTEPTAAHPLSGTRWMQALAVAWLLGDDALVAALTEPELVAATETHPHAARVPASYRLPLCRLLAALARREPLEIAAVRDAVDRDLLALEQPQDGSRLTAEWLQRDVLPLLPVVAAVDELGGAAPAGAGHAAFAAAAAEVRSPLVLLGLAALTARRSADASADDAAGRGEGPAPLLPLAGALELPWAAAPALGEAVRFEALPPIPALQVSPIPPLTDEVRVLDAEALEQLAEALWQAGDNAAWASEMKTVPPLRGSHVLVHLARHGRWAPRSVAHAYRLASALDEVSAPLREDSPWQQRWPAAELAAALPAFDEHAFRRSDELAFSSLTVPALVRVVARIAGAAPEALRGLTLTRSLEALVLLHRALAGEALEPAEQARATEALRDERGRGLEVADAAGALRELDYAAAGAALERAVGPRWEAELPADHPLRARSPAAQAAQAARRRIALKAQLDALIEAARRGRPPLATELGALAAHGAGLVDLVEPRYDALLAELGQAPSIAAARAAIALRCAVIGALQHGGHGLSERDVRYLLHVPAIAGALPPEERARWREDERAARARLGSRIDGGTRGAVQASWDPPEPTAAPATDPTPPGPAGPVKRRRIIT